MFLTGVIKGLGAVQFRVWHDPGRYLFGLPFRGAIICTGLGVREMVGRMAIWEKGGLHYVVGQESDET